MGSINPIHDWVSAPIPELLWHYTSIHGFIGIGTSKEIFATDSRFLNDREEIVHACKVARSLVEEYSGRNEQGLDLGKIAKFVVDDIFSVKTGLFSPDSLQSFVTSFSAARDSLSQWRAYSRGSSGVCLGFRIERALGHDLERSSDFFGGNLEKGFPPRFAPCVYDEDKKKNLLRYALSHIIEALQRVFSEVPEGITTLNNPPANGRFIQAVLVAHKSHSTSVSMLADALKHTVVDLLLIVALLKHEAFEEEEEWRLVLWRVASSQLDGPHIEFRPGNTALIPYLKFPFGSDSGVRLELDDLIVGPGSDEGAISSSKQFLHSMGITADPKLSAAPYRIT